ncbi:DUF222 domain-containing protein [Microbacterium fluvii]|uniref:DUF222 domain-containing protein n=1 Tax=Microbacterium fluvii TaxID=415215 RepID=A0ABW2HGW9_9MICO|nr:HNH endonuclease signature motif containing protein [Microbacterium fluvii]MCU4672662.1 HNH endonuclease [Microbacterium fluvii]
MSHPLPEPHPADPRRTEEFIDGFAELRRLRGAADAQELHLLARAGTVVTDADWTGRASTREIARRSLVAELACAARLSEWTVTRLLIEARDLCERFAPLVAALESGEISRQHVAVIHDAGAAIRDTADLERFTTAALARARETTPGRLGPIVRVLAERYLPVSLDERHAQAVADRSVEVRDLADGMASLMAVLPATLAHGIDDRLTAQARAVLAQTADEGESADAGASAEGEQACEGPDADPRTLAQARTDVFTDLLLGGTPDTIVAGDAAGAIRATVQVTVPVLTMIGESEEPCLLAGYGPIDSDTARILAANAPWWERLLTHPFTGQVLSVDRYRPSKPMRRMLAARDERCRFPGCRRPVHRCDVDHTVDHALGGETCVCNLAHLCRRHHTLKGASAWTVEQISAGVLVWTSPSGRRHTDRPEPTVRFEPDDELLLRRRFISEPWLVPPDYHHDGHLPPF